MNATVMRRLAPAAALFLLAPLIGEVLFGAIPLSKLPFGLLGVLLLTVFVGGAVFGTTIFLKRRKQQQEIFSDAGGMLRLELDPFEPTLLGLPPKRD